MAQNGVTNNELTYYVQFESAAKAANAITELQTQYQLSDGSISENTGVWAWLGKATIQRCRVCTDWQQFYLF